MKTKLTKEIIEELGFKLMENLIQDSFLLVLHDETYKPMFIGDNYSYSYKALSLSICNDKGQGEYYCFLREGDNNIRHEDNIVTITRNLQYKEDLENLLNILKL